MRIIRICPTLTHSLNYRKIIKDKLAGKNFYEQLEIYKENEIVIPGSWAKGLEDLGYEKVIDILPQDMELQYSWIETHKDDLQHNYYKLRTNFDFILTLMEQINYYKPDFIYLYAGGWMVLPPKVRKYIIDLKNTIEHKEFQFTGMWADELPKIWSYESWFDYCPFFFVSTNEYKKLCEKYTNKEIFVIGNSFSDYKKKIQYKKDKTLDLVFTGTTGYGVPEHTYRYEILDFLCKNTNIKIFTNEMDSFKIYPLNFYIHLKVLIIKFTSLLPRIILSKLAKLFSENSKLSNLFNWATRYKKLPENPIHYFSTSFHKNAKYFRDKKPLHKLYPDKVVIAENFGKKYNDIIANSKIVINTHRDEICDYGNIRDFEVTGLGSLLLTDKPDKMSELFVDGKEYVSFRNKDDLLEKIEYYLKNDEKREEIALAGMEKTHKNYLASHRALKIKKVLDEKINNKK